MRTEMKIEGKDYAKPNPQGDERAKLKEEMLEYLRSHEFNRSGTVKFFQVKYGYGFPFLKRMIGKEGKEPPIVDVVKEKNIQLEKGKLAKQVSLFLNRNEDGISQKLVAECYEHFRALGFKRKIIRTAMFHLATAIKTKYGLKDGRMAYDILTQAKSSLDTSPKLKAKEKKKPLQKAAPKLSFENSSNSFNQAPSLKEKSPEQKKEMTSTTPDKKMTPDQVTPSKEKIKKTPTPSKSPVEKEKSPMAGVKVSPCVDKTSPQHQPSSAKENTNNAFSIVESIRKSLSQLSPESRESLGIDLDVSTLNLENIGMDTSMLNTETPPALKSAKKKTLLKAVQKRRGSNDSLDSMETSIMKSFMTPSILKNDKKNKEGHGRRVSWGQNESVVLEELLPFSPLSGKKTPTVKLLNTSNLISFETPAKILTPKAKTPTPERKNQEVNKNGMSPLNSGSKKQNGPKSSTMMSFETPDQKVNPFKVKTPSPKNLTNGGKEIIVTKKTQSPSGTPEQKKEVAQESGQEPLKSEVKKSKFSPRITRSQKKKKNP